MKLGSGWNRCIEEWYPGFIIESYAGHANVCWRYIAKPTQKCPREPQIHHHRILPTWKARIIIQIVQVAQPRHGHRQQASRLGSVKNKPHKTPIVFGKGTKELGSPVT